jgi:hypothetical protein
VIGSLFVGAFVVATAPHRHNVALGIAGSVFVWFSGGLLVIELITRFGRQAERSHLALGKKGPGYAAVLGRSSHDPRFRSRMRIMWIIDVGFGLVALVAFFAG